MNEISKLIRAINQPVEAHKVSISEKRNSIHETHQ
jgi:hypothetical protein